MTARRSRAARGMSLIDVLVGVALLVVLLLALLGLLRASLLLSTLAKEKDAATALAQVQMEYLRSLTYDTLGTVGGIPAGPVPQTSVTVEDSTAYTTNTYIVYVDDPADGTGANDQNGITTDYKRARVAVSYAVGGITRSVILVSNFAPPGIETSTGGGTLAINVVNATGQPVQGATVAIVNASTTPTVNLRANTNAAGQVFLPGAATSTQYQVTVSKAGYSSAQTYALSAQNPNPNPGFLTVAASQTTTQTFAIDLLATLDLLTESPERTLTFSDAFADPSKLAAMSSTTVSGGELRLLTGETSGSARSVATSSPRLARWGSANASVSAPAGTTALIHIYDGNGALLPDSVLPGNAAGFSSFPVSLAQVSTSTYPQLALGVGFTTTNSSLPYVSTWSLSMTAGPFPLPNVGFTLTGGKTKGTSGTGTPIPKTVISASTGSDGTQGVTLEWDNYALAVPGYDILDGVMLPPYSLSPGATVSSRLILGPSTTNYLDVEVTDASGSLIPGASVTLTEGAYTKTLATSGNGVAYFGALTAAGDYAVTIAKSGYTTTTFSNVNVSGASTYNASFP